MNYIHLEVSLEFHPGVADNAAERLKEAAREQGLIVTSCKIVTDA